MRIFSYILLAFTAIILLLCYYRNQALLPLNWQMAFESERKEYDNMFRIKNRIILPTFWPLSCRFSIRRRSWMLTLQPNSNVFVYQLTVFRDNKAIAMHCHNDAVRWHFPFSTWLDFALSIEFHIAIALHLNCKFHSFRVKMLHFSIFRSGHSSCSFRFMFFQLWMHFEHLEHVRLHSCIENTNMLIANHVNMIANMKTRKYAPKWYLLQNDKFNFNIF